MDIEYLVSFTPLYTCSADFGDVCSVQISDFLQQNMSHVSVK